MHDHPESKTAEPGLIEEALDEHRDCMRLVSSLEDCLDHRPDDPEAWVVDLQTRMEQLGTALRRHFEGEEAGPMFRSLPEKHPRLAPALAKLEAEHPELLQDLEITRKRAAELESPEMYELRELNARVQLFVARIRRHEAAENELMFRAYWNEVGEGD